MVVRRSGGVNGANKEGRERCYYEEEGTTTGGVDLTTELVFPRLPAFDGAQLFYLTITALFLICF